MIDLHSDYLSRTLQTSRLSMYDMMVGRHRLCIHKGSKGATSQGRKRHHDINIVTIVMLNSKEPTSEEVNKHKEAGLFVQPWLVVFLIFVWAGHSRTAIDPSPCISSGPSLTRNSNKESNNHIMPFKLLFARLAMKHRKKRQEQSKAQAAGEAKPLGDRKTAGRDSGESTAAQASEGSHTEGTRRQRRRDRKANRA
ncbi:hypothetical protein FPV67DRAFT_1449176 [Lyophyllum atratum]|nr:hypothetical protein FPV67DRAFT_1449176 [Lyophyllum atratum]